MSDPLMRELNHHEYFRVQLAERFPDADDETLADTVEGMTHLNEMLAAVVRSQLDDRVLASALKARIDEMHERMKRLELRVDRKRELVATVMERAQIKRMTEPDFTLSLRQGQPKLVVVDESAIAEDYWRPQPPKLDRRRLLDQLKTGTVIDGATLSNGGLSISVRVT